MGNIKMPAPYNKTDNPNPNGKHPGGRTSKKSKINYDGLKLCYSKGFTDAETAIALQITEQTLNNWKIADSKFFEALKDWKLEADRKIVKSLYERGKGYSHPDTKAQWVENDVFDPESGEWKKVGRWEYADLIKHYPPDPTSMIFWLKNRQPAKWRDKVEQDVNLTGKITFKVIYDDGPAQAGGDEQD